MLRTVNDCDELEVLRNSLLTEVELLIKIDISQYNKCVPDFEKFFELVLFGTFFGNKNIQLQLSCS